MENIDNLQEQLKISLQKIRHQITELEMLDSRSKRSQELFTALFISSPIGIFIVQDGKFVDVNPQFEKLIGFSKAELRGTNSLNLVVPENCDHVKENAIKPLFIAVDGVWFLKIENNVDAIGLHAEAFETAIFLHQVLHDIFDIRNGRIQAFVHCETAV